jgi:hypothetical protein
VGDAIQPCNNSTPAGKGAHVLAIRRYMHTVVHRIAQQLADLLIIIIIIIIIIIMLPNQAIASTPSAPRPSGAEGRGSTAPLCLQLLRTSQACTRYSAILLAITLADLLIQQNMHARSVHMQISGGKEAEKQLCKLTN